MAKSAVATVKKTEVDFTASEAFDQFEGQGLEQVTANDLLIPRVTILQQLSPQLNRKKSEFLEGAEIGDICDVGLGEFWKDGIIFLPVYYRKDFLEWAPRSSGKGLVNIHSDPSIMDRCQRDEKNRPVLPSGNYIGETAQFFGINLSAAEMRRCFLPMSSTQLKKARKWITLSTGEKLKRKDGSEFTPPLFYRTYMLTTAEESNNEGDWRGWVVNRGPSLPEYCESIGLDFGSTMKMIQEFYKSLVSGEVKADTSSLSDDEAIVEGKAEEVM